MIKVGHFLLTEGVFAKKMIKAQRIEVKWEYTTQKLKCFFFWKLIFIEK